MFFDATAASAYNYVVINFDFRMTSSGSPADGMGFVFMNTANGGTSGAPATGWSEDANFGSSIGVGFDNYFNMPATANEPNGNHVSLHWNGNQIAGAAATPSLTLPSGQFHHAQIIIKFQTSQALVTVKLKPDVNGAGGATETLFNDYVINGVTPYRGRAGFCARTGGSFADQDIDNLSVEYLTQAPATPGGLSLLLLPDAAFGTTGAGTTTSDYLDAPDLANTFALDFLMHSSTLINDVDVHWNGATAGSAFVSPNTLNLDSGVFHHAHLEVVKALEGSYVNLTLTPDVFGTPGAPVNVYSDLLVPNFFPGNSRVEFASRSGGMDLGIDLENVEVSYAKYAPNLLAPNQSLLLVSSMVAFQSRYGTGFNVVGQYTGYLDNAGEHLRLSGPYGEPILDFTYKDGWQPMTDGNGFSLVFPDPLLSSDMWDAAANWRASSAVGGSPGLADPPPASFTPVVINEALAHSQPPFSDAIELYNPGGTTADIGNWYLSDNFRVPKKFRIPAGTSIAPNDYLVFYENQFNPSPGSPTSFALRAEGDQVYLFSANAAGELTGYYHGFDFGPSDVNVSFGRWVTSEGKDDFVAQTAVTLNAVNDGPIIGPVVISEIMYHPPDYQGGLDNQDDEYIKLHNISDGPVLLYDLNHPANTWRLKDAVDFQFPVNTVLPAGEDLLVVSFDPVIRPDLLAAFWAAYGFDDSVPVFGPYDGKLDNSADSVELAKPGEPDPDTLLPDYILVDKVKYSDLAPWPTEADGQGLSLLRIDVAAYGNDPANWTGRKVALPRILTQPESQTVDAGGTAMLSVVASGTGSLSYQWRRNGIDVPGATSASLTVTDLQLDVNDGIYTVVVTDAVGSRESHPALVLLLLPPAIVEGPFPTNQVVASGSTFTISLTVRGTLPIGYYWRLGNGYYNFESGGGYTYAVTNSAYVSTSVLVITNAQKALHENRYRVGISNSVQTYQTASAYAYVTVIDGPAITLQPTNQSAALGAPVTFHAGASGEAPLTFQWWHNDAPIAGATGTSYSLNSVQASDAGAYTFVASNPAASATSHVAYLTLPVAPTIVTQPADQAVHVCSNAVFTVEASGAPLSYQWWFNATNRLANETNASLVIVQPGLADEGRYSVVVSNLFGATPSDAATLTLLDGDSDGDGMSDTWELAHGLNPCDASDRDLDPDHDGRTNWQEFVSGTDPGSNASVLRVSLVGDSGGARIQFKTAPNVGYTIPVPGPA